MTLPKLELSNLIVNSTGWGPTLAHGHVVESYQGLPFQQFNKCDRIGRIVDWLGVERFYKKGDTRDRYNERIYGSSATAGAQFDYVHDNEEANFQLVDSSKPQKPQKNFRRQFVFKKLGQKDQDRRELVPQSNKMKRSIAKEKMRAFKQWQRRGGIRGGNGQQQNRGPMNQRRFGDRHGGKSRQPSVQVKPDWKVMEELDFHRLSKLSLPNVEVGQDIVGESYGVLHYFDKNTEKVSVKNSIPLQKCGGTFYNLTTTEDPVIQKLAQNNVGNVFGTDILLATLMSATRSVNSWDIIVQRVSNKLFFDKRETDGFSNPIDALSVSETATEPPSNETNGINNATDLATEALFINQNFRRQVLKRNGAPVFKCENERAPFEDEGADSKVECAYRYRLWNLGNMSDGTPIKLVARTETDGVMAGLKPEDKPYKLTIKAFNEWDSSQSGGVDWRTKLETQKGAVLATELKNNSCKLAKWTLQAILSGSDYMKMGYVSRLNIRNSAQHVILAVNQGKPLEFVATISLNLDNCWGILRMIIEYFMKQPTGKYLLLKDPLQQVVRIYSLPDGTFDSSDESEESSSGEDEADDE